MPMLTWLADVLRDADLPVREVPGWRTRGHGAMGEVLGVLAHHTAGGAKGLYPSESIVVHGRPGLAGPLCNLGLDRAGTWIVVAAGQAWHAGTGSAPWCPANQGNSRLIGVEAESVGTRDDWTAEQRQSYPRGCAALLRHLGLGSYRVIGHKEWAPNRKIDPAFWDMGAFRAETARWMSVPTSPTTGEQPVSAPWNAPIDDPYTAKPGDTLPAGAALAWAAANAGFARDAALNARDAAAAAAAGVARVEQKLDELLARPAAQLDPAVVTAAIAEALGGGLQITGTAVPQRKA